MSVSDFLNTIRLTLGADLQRWRFIGPEIFDTGWLQISVSFLGTGDYASIAYDGQWIVTSNCRLKAERLTSRLSGHVRDAAGNLVEVAK